MKQLLLAAILTLPLMADAAFIVRDFKGAVTSQTGVSRQLVSKGKRLSASDIITVPDGGSVDILNDVTNKIYTSTTPGTMTLSRLIAASQKKADDKTGAVNSRLRLSGAATGDGQARVYVEQGMVKRALSEYDPEGSGFAMDPQLLGQRVAEARLTVNGSVDSPLVWKAGRGADGAELEFELTNNQDYPLYFNIIRLTGGVDPRFEVSCLGQPTGNYLLLPGQTMIRRHGEATPAGEKHLLVATDCQYDLDALLAAANAAIDAAPAFSSTLGSNIPSPLAGNSEPEEPFTCIILPF